MDKNENLGGVAGIESEQEQTSRKKKSNDNVCDGGGVSPSSDEASSHTGFFERIKEYFGGGDGDSHREGGGWFDFGGDGDGGDGGGDGGD